MKKLYITLRNKSNSIAARAKIALDSKRAEMYVDKGVGIIIAVVVGGVLLAGIYSLFNTTIIPKMTTEISNMFNYAGRNIYSEDGLCSVLILFRRSHVYFY